jgi:hypothetical protein
MVPFVRPRSNHQKSNRPAGVKKTVSVIGALATDEQEPMPTYDFPMYGHSSAHVANIAALKYPNAPPTRVVPYPLHCDVTTTHRLDTHQPMGRVHTAAVVATSPIPKFPQSTPQSEGATSGLGGRPLTVSTTYSLFSEVANTHTNTHSTNAEEGYRERDEEEDEDDATFITTSSGMDEWQLGQRPGDFRSASATDWHDEEDLTDSSYHQHHPQHPQHHYQHSEMGTRSISSSFLERQAYYAQLKETQLHLQDRMDEHRAAVMRAHSPVRSLEDYSREREKSREIFQQAQEILPPELRRSPTPPIHLLSQTGQRRSQTVPEGMQRPSLLSAAISENVNMSDEKDPPTDVLDHYLEPEANVGTEVISGSVNRPFLPVLGRKRQEREKDRERELQSAPMAPLDSPTLHSPLKHLPMRRGSLVQDGGKDESLEMYVVDARVPDETGAWTRQQMPTTLKQRQHSRTSTSRRGGLARRGRR